MTDSRHPRLVFQPTMESLLRALGPRLDAACAARLKAVGVDPGAPLQDAYPVSVFAAAIRVVGEVLVPGDPLGEGVREVGRSFVQRFRETAVGRAGLTVARLMGPELLVRRMEQAVRLGDNYTRCHAEQVGPRHYHLQFQPAQLPPFYEGLLEEALAVVGGRQVRATLLRSLDDGFVFSVQWE